jgi:hypothetical protein
MLNRSCPEAVVAWSLVALMLLSELDGKKNK